VPSWARPPSRPLYPPPPHPIPPTQELEYIFGAIVRAFSEQLADTLETLLSQGGAWEPVVRASALYMLQVGWGGVGMG
jgi:hypothetical protein